MNREKFHEKLTEMKNKYPLPSSDPHLYMCGLNVYKIAKSWIGTTVLSVYILLSMIYYLYCNIKSQWDVKF